MKVSVQLPTCTEGLVNPIPFARAPEDVVYLVKGAERLGDDGVWGNDHITVAPYVRDHWKTSPNFYEVLLSLATVGAHTSKVHLRDNRGRTRMALPASQAAVGKRARACCRGTLRRGYSLGRRLHARGS